MPKFRKKPVVIEAVKWTGGNFDEIRQFCPTARYPIAKGSREVIMGPELIIPTLEGDHLATAGDWIICGIKSEFYPCKPDVFEKTYDLVTDDQG